uniref:Uncharacterized protein n=1 Tax=Oryctolagus cuniculus TaxID=9986 RepID=A0A5F9DH35_RABIT
MNHLYPKSLFYQGVLDVRIHIFDLDRKKAKVDELSLCGHMVSDEHEQLSSEALEAACIDTNQHMVKSSSQAAFHGQVQPYLSHVDQHDVLLCCRRQDPNRYRQMERMKTKEMCPSRKGRNMCAGAHPFTFSIYCM